jgi:hypothetical protein
MRISIRSLVALAAELVHAVSNGRGASEPSPTDAPADSSASAPDADRPSGRRGRTPKGSAVSDREDNHEHDGRPWGAGLLGPATGPEMEEMESIEPARRLLAEMAEEMAAAIERLTLPAPAVVPPVPTPDVRA